MSLTPSCGKIKAKYDTGDIFNFKPVTTDELRKNAWRKRL